jgi:hypothetical protein
MLRRKGTSCIPAFAFYGQQHARVLSSFSRTFNGGSSSRSLHGSGCPCCPPPSGARSWRTHKAPDTMLPNSRSLITYNADATAGEVIECDAAVAFGVNDVRVTRVKVAPPKKGEVRLKVVSNALCHTE